MGSDLYNNLIRYFVQHLKSLRDVGTRATFIPVSCDSVCGAACTGFRFTARRGPATVLREGMGPLHDWCKLHQPTLHIPESPLG